MSRIEHDCLSNILSPFSTLNIQSSSEDYQPDKFRTNFSIKTYDVQEMQADMMNSELELEEWQTIIGKSLGLHHRFRGAVLMKQSQLLSIMTWQWPEHTYQRLQSIIRRMKSILYIDQYRDKLLSTITISLSQLQHFHDAFFVMNQIQLSSQYLSCSAQVHANRGWCTLFRM